MNNRLRLSYNVTAELVPLFTKELELCKVKPGELVMLLADSRTNPHYPAAFFGAAKGIGAEVFQVVVPYTSSERRVAGEHVESMIPRAVAECMKRCDMVIDMLTVDWLYTGTHKDVLASGARTLMVKEPEDVLLRMFPDEKVRARGCAGQKVLAQARQLRITSEWGTDLSLDKSGRGANYQWGVSDTPGRWDHWPSGLVACAPLEGSATGTLVLGPGDLILGLGRYVSQPTTLVFKDGFVAGFEGGVDAFLLQEYLGSFSDRGALVPAHAGWGTDDRALWNTLGMLTGVMTCEGGGIMDAESYYGSFMLGLGSNVLSMLGGANRTRAHVDLCLRNCTVDLDGVRVLDRGTFVLPELL